MSTRNKKISSVDPACATARISQIIDRSGKSQTFIAEQLGYRRSNIISMWKSGKTRLPLENVEPLANLCGADPAELMRVVLGSEYPELLDFIERYPEVAQIPS